MPYQYILQEFIIKTIIPSPNFVFRIALEAVANNIKFIRRHSAAVAQWLKENVSNADA